MIELKVDENGKFFFTENGQIITDSTRIRYIKRYIIPDWKEQVCILSETLMKEITQSINEKINFYKNIPKVITEVNVHHSIDNLICKTYEIPKYEGITVNEIKTKAKKDSIRYAKINTTDISFLKRNKAQRKICSEKYAEFLELHQELNLKKEKLYYSNMADIKKEKDKEFYFQYKTEKQLLEKLIQNDMTIINQFLSDYLNFLNANIKGLKIKGAYNIIEGCKIEIILPNNSCIESRKAKILSSGRISVKQRNINEINSDWYTFCNGLILNIAGNIFNINTNIQKIFIIAKYVEMNQTIGLPEYKKRLNCCFLRNLFCEINFENIDPNKTVRLFDFKNENIRNKDIPSNYSNKNNNLKITRIDELSEKSFETLLENLNFIKNKFGLSIFSEKNNHKLISISKDVLFDHKAEKELLIICINNNVFSDLLKNDKTTSLIILEQILLDNEFIDYKNFLSNIIDFFEENNKCT